MTKKELADALRAARAEYKEGLQTLWDSINKGQQKQLYKKDEIRAILDRFGVEVNS